MHIELQLRATVAKLSLWVESFSFLMQYILLNFHRCHWIYLHFYWLFIGFHCFFDVSNLLTASNLDEFLFVDICSILLSSNVALLINVDHVSYTYKLPIQQWLFSFCDNQSICVTVWLYTYVHYKYNFVVMVAYFVVIKCILCNILTNQALCWLRYFSITIISIYIAHVLICTCDIQ